MNVDASKPNKTQKSLVEILGKVLASIAALAAVTLLVINLISFLDTVNYYLAQGYPSAEVFKQLIPSQLLPGVFEPIAIYGGIAFLLFYVGKLNQKVSKCLALLTVPESGDDSVEEGISEPEIVEEEGSVSESGIVEEEEIVPAPVTIEKVESPSESKETD